MHDRTLKVLEFHKIKEQLLEHASSSLGQEKIHALYPSTEFQEVKKWQEETDEAAAVLRVKGHVPLDGMFDIRSHVKRASIGGMLNPLELMQIGSTIHASHTLKKFIEQLSDSELNVPILKEYGNNLFVLTELERSIRRAIDENGTILDSASETLRQLRNQLRLKEGRVREKLENMIRSQNAQKMLSDAIVTIRNDRFVIPVKQEYRSHYGGIVHDQSSSGQTLFIEPQVIVELNNEIQAIRVKEQQEMERILLDLSHRVGDNRQELDSNVEILAQIDFMFAKARYGKTIQGSKPKINQEGKIALYKARHPLIPLEQVVANDIFLGKDYSMMVITGPNTGGKTVTLKTVGLCTLMAQAGLQVPALDDSEVAVFSSIFADIGDEQSIEQSLSTFSSHMTNIVHILEHADARSLILFDELGAGTDPQEGAALAISILDEVYKMGARVIATTHYPELKAYGYNREGVINASVEFDIETLSPTYKLFIGVPGRSNAFEISKRLGLKETIIEAAKNHVNAESNQVEKMIVGLEESKKEADKKLQEVQNLLKEAEMLHIDLRKQVIKWYDYKDSLYEKARKEAEQIVEKAKVEAEEIIRHLRKLQLEKVAEIKEHEFIEAKRKLEEVVPKEKEKKTSPINKKYHDFKAGDEVNVLSFNQKGFLIEKASDKEWIVQMGIMKMKVDEKDLEYIKSEKVQQEKAITTVKGKDFHVSLELDLRGERYEDALVRLEKYIDDALLAGYPRVSIIHGKGTGALRQGVQEYLRNHRSVKRTRFGDAHEGGTGVTIVEFK